MYKYIYIYVCIYIYIYVYTHIFDYHRVCHPAGLRCSSSMRENANILSKWLKSPVPKCRRPMQPHPDSDDTSHGCATVVKTWCMKRKNRVVPKVFWTKRTTNRQQWPLFQLFVQFLCFFFSLIVAGEQRIQRL